MTGEASSTEWFLPYLAFALFVLAFYAPSPFCRCVFSSGGIRMRGLGFPIDLDLSLIRWAAIVPRFSWRRLRSPYAIMRYLLSLHMTSGLFRASTVLVKTDYPWPSRYIWVSPSDPELALAKLGLPLTNVIVDGEPVKAAARTETHLWPIIPDADSGFLSKPANWLAMLGAALEVWILGVVVASVGCSIFCESQSSVPQAPPWYWGDYAGWVSAGFFLVTLIVGMLLWKRLKRLAALSPACARPLWFTLQGYMFFAVHPMRLFLEYLDRRSRAGLDKPTGRP